jgi:hypothetical protein
MPTDSHNWKYQPFLPNSYYWYKMNVGGGRTNSNLDCVLLTLKLFVKVPTSDCLTLLNSSF